MGHPDRRHEGSDLSYPYVKKRLGKREERPERGKGRVPARARFLLGDNEPKKCVTCNQRLLGRDFAKDRHNIDGRRNECKLCRKIRRSELAEGAIRLPAYGLRKWRRWLKKKRESGLLGQCNDESSPTVA